MLTMHPETPSAKKRILVLCGDDAAAVSAANVYADLLRDHDLRFFEERIVSPRRIVTFCRRRAQSKGLLSLFGSLAYYGLRLALSAATPAKRYSPALRSDSFTTDPRVHAELRAFAPDIVLTASCGMLGADLLALLPEATYNIHPGVNPRYRGFGNIWALSENRPDLLGYTIHKVDAGVDTGARLAVVPLTVRELAGVPFVDLDVPVFTRAARHLAGILLGQESATIHEPFRNLPSRCYGVPTVAVFWAARAHFAAACRQMPRHVLITGASSGLGAALAEGYAAPGMRLTLWARNSERLEHVAARCRALGATAAVISHDLRDLEASRTLLRNLDDRHPVDLALLGAGVSSGTLPDGTPEPVEAACRTMTINATAAINMVGTLLEAMRPRGCGQVVCISSLAALYPLPDSPAYSAAKTAFACYAKALRPHVRPVRVSIVYPGYVDTPMSRRLAGPQPLRWSAERAAAHIRTRLDAGAETIVFPLLLALGTCLLHFLPARLAAFFCDRFGFVISPDLEAASPPVTGGIDRNGDQGSNPPAFGHDACSPPHPPVRGDITGGQP